MFFSLAGKKPEQTAAYIHHFDVCINPQQVNPLTIGNYPRKIDEYLASGKPVVATATQAMEMFREYVSLCQTKEEYVVSIRKLLDEKVWTTRESARSQAGICIDTYLGKFSRCDGRCISFFKKKLPDG